MTEKRGPNVLTGDKDGVVVVNEPENQRFIIDLPNSYDVYWAFSAKDGFDFARRVQHPDVNNKRAAFEVPWDNLMSEDAIKSLNFKVAAARRTFVELQAEKEEFADILAFDLTKPEKNLVVLRKDPENGYARGEVVRTGKYFVALASENDTTVFLRMVYANRFLNGKDEFENREETIKERFPVGSIKSLRWDKQGRRITAADYVPKDAQAVQSGSEQSQATPAAEPSTRGLQEASIAPAAVPTRADMPQAQPEPVQAMQKPSEATTAEEKPQLTADQKKAVIAFREANLPTWKVALGKAWESGNYGNTDRDHAALLQQVRNELGPEWLQKLRAEDLYPKATKEQKAQEHARKLAGRKSEAANSEAHPKSLSM